MQVKSTQGSLLYTSSCRAEDDCWPVGSLYLKVPKSSDNLRIDRNVMYKIRVKQKTAVKCNVVVHPMSLSLMLSFSNDFKNNCGFRTQKLFPELKADIRYGRSLRSYTYVRNSSN